MLNKSLKPSFLLIIMLLSVNAEVTGDQQSLAPDITDMTKNFTDIELELALSDLSLRDLNTLQKFISSADNQEFYYDEVDKKSKSYDCFNFEDDNINLETGFPAISQHLKPNDTPKPIKNFNENFRSKREDNEIKTYEEYIKQLDYSFPQNAKPNSNEMEFNKEHIRVKRN